MNKLFLAVLLSAVSMSSFSQRIYCEGNKLMMNGNPIYMNACNTPWDKWNDFGGSYNSTFWEAEFERFNDYGINSTRIWISCSGEVDPQIDIDGKVTGVSAKFWEHCDDLMARAEAHKIYIMPTMLSFDHTKNTYTTYERYRKMIASKENIQSFIDNYLVPFVERYKDNPYLFNVDICNEMEWMNQNPECGTVPWADLQLYAAMCSAAIHKSASDVTVSLGSAAVKWGSDAQNIQGKTNVGNCEGNVWSDANLQAQFNDPEAFLDIWQVHYYSWVNDYYGNPFEIGPVGYNLNDRPCLIGEMPGRPNLMGVDSITTMDQCFNAAKRLGYQGHYPWTSNNAGSGDFGSLSTFGAALTAFKTKHEDLVFPPLLQCQAPQLDADMTLCGATFPILLETNTTVTAGASYTWYKDDAVISGADLPNFSLQDASSAGVYRVVRDSAGCSRSATIAVSDQLPAIDLGDDANLCNPASILLSTGVSGNGVAYVWTKDGTVISGAESESFTVTQAGVYTAEISASGCDAQTDQITVTSDLIAVTGGERCDAGEIILTVDETGGIYEWYDVATGGIALHTGTEYSPTVAVTTNYYIKDASGIAGQFGKTEVGTGNVWNIQGAEFASSDKTYTVTVSQTVNLVSVDVYVTSAGDVTVNLMQGSVVAHTASLTGLSTGKHTIPLNFSVDPGSYVINLVGTTGQIGFEASGGSFPYEYPGYISFTYNESWQSEQYGTFYNWQIMVVNTCARSMVQAVVDPNNSLCSSTETVSVHLDAGWNIVSLYVSPTDAEISTVFPYATIVKTQDSFFSANQPDYLNTLSVITGGTAYLVNNSLAETVSISGSALASDAISVLKNGWNLVGVPSALALPLTALPNSISSVKDLDNFYIPGNGNNTLTELEPTKGYFILVE